LPKPLPDYPPTRFLSAAPTPSAPYVVAPFVFKLAATLLDRDLGIGEEFPRGRSAALSPWACGPSSNAGISELGRRGADRAGCGRDHHRRSLEARGGLVADTAAGAASGSTIPSTAGSTTSKRAPSCPLPCSRGFLADASRCRPLTFEGEGFAPVLSRQGHRGCRELRRGKGLAVCPIERARMGPSGLYVSTCFSERGSALASVVRCSLMPLWKIGLISEQVSKLASGAPAVRRCYTREFDPRAWPS
jgi:hypothetical protein